MNIDYPKLGILGGGQLARMLALKAHQMGVLPLVMSSESTDPAAQVTRHWFHGNVNDAQSLKKFLEQVDVASFESEFLDPEKLQLATQFSKKSIFPATDIMAKLQDRKSQKSILEKYKIPVAPWIFVENSAQAEKILQSLDGQMILKKCRFGYDGYGTYSVKSPKDLALAFEKENPFGFIAEARIHFKRELAFMMVRDQFGTIISLPLVESYQENSCCLWVKGPLQHPEFKKIESKFRRLLSALNYVGAIGIELFDCGGKLLVNEIAPRVHNSGHYSLDALNLDQFSLHIMAVMGMKIPKKVELKTKAFAMLNLLGANYNPAWTQHDVCFHWYEKTQVRAGRKMGHVTALDSRPELALQKLLKLNRQIQTERK